jgi:hypothetical protein
MHRVVSTGARFHFALRHEDRKGGVASYLKDNGHRGVLAANAGPENHSIIEGITAGNTMLEQWA